MVSTRYINDIPAKRKARKNLFYFRAKVKERRSREAIKGKTKTLILGTERIRYMDIKMAILLPTNTEKNFFRKGHT